jgi:predicted phosphodiesterase
MSVVHETGPSAGRERRCAQAFPDSDVLVFGHSHIPWDAAGVDVRWLFNPGSATLRRRQPHKTMGVVDVRSGRVRTKIVTLA